MILLIYHIELAKSVIITYDSVEKEIYTEALLSAYFSCNEEWMLRGVKEILYGTPAGSKELQSFYDKRHNINNLHLTPWTFTEFFNKDNLDAAEDTAARLIKYIEARYGKEKLLGCFKIPGMSRNFRYKLCYTEK